MSGFPRRGGGGVVDAVVAGTGVTVSAADPANPIVAALAVLQSIVAGANVTVDATDPANPIVAASGGGGGGVASVVAGTDLTVDATDPANPIVALADPLVDVITITNIATGDKVVIDARQAHQGPKIALIAHSDVTPATVLAELDIAAQADIANAIANAYWYSQSEDGTLYAEMRAQATGMAAPGVAITADNFEDGGFGISLNPAAAGGVGFGLTAPTGQLADLLQMFIPGFVKALGLSFDGDLDVGPQSGADMGVKGLASRSPDGTRYRLVPANGGGAAVWA